MVAIALERAELLGHLPMREVRTKIASARVFPALGANEPTADDVIMATSPDFLVANAVLAEDAMHVGPGGTVFR